MHTTRSQFTNASLLKLTHGIFKQNHADGLGLSSIRYVFQAILYRLQRGKVLERWRFLEKYYLVSLDGTQFFSSHQVHCKHCCEKNHRNGSITYHHQMVVGSICAPGIRQVLPIWF